MSDGKRFSAFKTKEYGQYTSTNEAENNMIKQKNDTAVSSTQKHAKG